MKTFKEVLNENKIKINNDNGLGSVPNNNEVDYLGLRVIMKPSVFLQLATYPPDVNDIDYIKNHINNNDPIASPFLIISIPEEWENNEFNAIAEIVGHEGRHRMYVIKKFFNDEAIETHLFFSNGIRNRHLNNNIINKLNTKLKNRDLPGLIFDGPFFKQK